MRFRISLAILLVGAFLAACAAPAPTPTHTPRPTATTAPTSTPRPSNTPRPPPPTTAPPQPCEGDTQPAAIPYTLTEPGTEVEMLWRTGFVPWWVRPSPDGRVLAVTNGGDSIYELKPDGTLGVAFRCPGVAIETFAAATDGALWFATPDGGRLYRVDADGTVEILSRHGNRNLEAGPDGSVYAMENGLVRI